MALPSTSNKPRKRHFAMYLRTVNIYPRHSLDTSHICLSYRGSRTIHFYYNSECRYVTLWTKASLLNGYASFLLQLELKLRVTCCERSLRDRGRGPYLGEVEAARLRCAEQPRQAVSIKSKDGCGLCQGSFFGDRVLVGDVSGSLGRLIEDRAGWL